MRNDIREMRHMMRDGARGITQLKLRFNSQQHKIEPPYPPKAYTVVQKCKGETSDPKIVILTMIVSHPDPAKRHTDETEIFYRLGHSVNKSLLKFSTKNRMPIHSIYAGNSRSPDKDGGL